MTPPSAQRPTPTAEGSALVFGIALAVGVAAASLLDVADVLPGHVATALRPLEPPASPPEGGITLCHDCGVAPVGVARGMQVVLLLLLAGGLPAAVAAGLLAVSAGSQRWSAGWEPVFRAGFLFQLNSVALSALLLALVVWGGWSFAEERQYLVPWGSWLLLSIVAGVPGLKAWRILQAASGEPPLSLALCQGLAPAASSGCVKRRRY